MSKQVLLRIAQILIAVPFAYFGISHLMAGSAMAPMVPFPPATFWVYFTGVAQLLAAIAFVLNIQVRLAAWLLALYLLIILLSIQIPGAIHKTGDPMMLVKDIGLLGGAILLAAAHTPGRTVEKRDIL